MATSKENISKIIRFRQLRAFRARYPQVAFTGKCLLLFAIFYIVAVRKLDPDFGWHLQAGNYIRAHGIPAHDIYSYTARTYAWIDHEWGNDVIVSLLYQWGGYALVSLLYALLWTASLVLASARARLSVLFIAALAVIPYSGIRPVSWTVLFLVVTFRLLNGRRTRLAWLLPLLFVVWSNLHAGFIVGLAMILYTALSKRRPALLSVFVLSVAATFVNAYGLRLYTEIAHTLFDPQIHSQVAEWNAFSIPVVSVLFVVLWIAGGVLFEPQTLTRWLRPSVLLLLASASATRNVPLFVVGALAETNNYFDAVKKAVPHSITTNARRLSTVFIVVFAAAVLYCAYLSFSPLRVSREAAYPIAAVSYLQAHGCAGGHMLNDYDYGGYLIWKLPSQPVYIDGRMPTWRDPGGRLYMSRYLDLLQYPQSYHQEFRRYNIRCVLLKRTSQDRGLQQLLRHDHWQTVIETPDYLLQIVPN